MENYYDILGVKKGASKDEIKKAYKLLVKEYHPDVNKSSNATSMFRLINDAYEHLMDDEFEYSADNSNDFTCRNSHTEHETSYNSHQNHQNNYYTYTSESKQAKKYKSFFYSVKSFILKILACIAFLFIGIIYLIVFAATCLGGMAGYLFAGILCLLFIAYFIMALFNSIGWIMLLYIVLVAAALLLVFIIATAVHVTLIIVLSKLKDFILE